MIIAKLKVDKAIVRLTLILILLTIFLVLCLLSIRWKTLTYDEPGHYRYGTNILELDSGRFDDSKMPFSALNAAPRKISGILPEGSFKNFLSKVQTGRIVTILFSLATSLVVFTWSRALYGFIPGLFSLVLYIFDPNIIAHSRLITTDIFVTGMITLSMFLLWKFTRERNWKNTILSAMAIGVSQLAKYTSLFLYPLSFGVLLIRGFPYWKKLVVTKNRRDFLSSIKTGLLYSIVFIAISVLIINAGFLFNKPFVPLGRGDFYSDVFQSLQSKLSQFKEVPIPLPWPFMSGLDLVSYGERTGEGYGRIYLLEELRSGEGFSGYYLLAYLFKVPIATQIIVILAVVVFIIGRNKRQFLENELFLVGPIVFFSIYFNFYFRAQIGIRFILVIFPFLYIFCGSLLKNWQPLNSWKRSVVGLLLIYLIGSVLSYFPHYIPYFNELVWDRRLSYKVLADSNLDWGQGEYYLTQYLDLHPYAQFEPSKPVYGEVVVSANRLVGVLGDPERFKWLRDHFEPDETIAYSYLVYKITAEELEKARSDCECF